MTRPRTVKPAHEQIGGRQVRPRGRLNRKPRDKTAVRGYSGKWLRLRRMVINRDPLCVICQKSAATDVDHIVPLNQGGTNKLSNLQGLCHSCHSRKTARDDGGFGRSKNHG